MSFRKSIRNALRACLSIGALGAVLWACHVANEEQAFMDVHADSTWTSFDQVAVVITGKDGSSPDTLFKGKLVSLDQLKKLPVPGYTGGQVEIILIGFKNGKPAKKETRTYDGQTQSETGPNIIVIIPIDSLPVGPGDSALDIKPDMLRLYVGGPAGSLAPAGTAWIGKTLAWTSSDPKVAGVENGSVTPVAAGQAFIRAVSGAAKDSAAVTVVLDAPILDLGKDTAVAINSTVAFQVGVRQEYGGVAAFKWSLDGDSQWDDSAAGLPADKTVLVTAPRKFTQAGSFILRFLVRDGEGNEATGSRLLIVSSQVPRITSLEKDAEITAGDSIGFTGKAEVNTGSLKKYAWAYGDGSAVVNGTLSGASATVAGGHRFATEGSFQVTLTVEDDAGTAVSASVNVKVDPKGGAKKPPVAQAGADTSVSLNAAVRLHGTATDADGTVAKLEWSVDGAPFAIATGGDTAFAAKAVGTVRCILRATDNDGLTGLDTMIVTVTKPAAKPPVAHAGNDTSVQVFTKADLRGSATDADGTIAKLEWNIGGGGFIATSGDTAFTPATAGTVRCILRATDNDGLTGLDTVIVSVTQSPPPAITAFTPAADTDISIRDSVSFSAKVSGSSPLASYSWDFNADGVADESGILTGTSATLKTGKRFAVAGTYLVSLKVTDQAANTQSKQVSVLVVTDPPQANAGADTTVNAGTRANLHGKATDNLGKIVKTEWRIGAGAYAVAPPETSITAPAVGSVTINCMLRVTDDDGLQDSDQVVVTVKPSTDATLKTLALSAGTLAPAFTSTGITYTASVGEAVTSITATPGANSTAASIVVNGAGVPSGSASGPINLVTGANVITIVVTAQDLTTKKTYSVTVTQLDQTPPAAPTVNGTTPSFTATPAWSWVSGGGGNGSFRYKLDNSDLTTGATATTALSYTPATALADGFHTLYVQERDAAGNWSASGTFQIAVTVGPVSWYKFDGDFKDSGPNADNGAATGTVTFIPDHLGTANKAVSFASGNGKVTTGDAPIGLGPTFTFTAWVMLKDSVDLQYFMEESNGGFGMASSYGGIYAVLISGATNSAFSAVTIGQWTHITGTYDGTNIRIYKNGVLQQTTPQDKTGYTWSVSQLILGFSSPSYWTGALDDLRFYNRVLTPSEISAIAAGTM